MDRDKLVSDNFREVAKTFREIAKKGHTVEMDTATVSEEPGCGTVACMAGHYLLAKLKKTDRYLADPESYMQEKVKLYRYTDSGERLEFEDGASWLATNLGFDDEEDLEMFMYNNDDLWGNEYGRLLFAEPAAYEDVSRNEPLTLHHIATKFEQIAERIDKEQRA